MSKPAIRVENLSKLYKIGTRQNGSYRTLHETITDGVAARCEGKAAEAAVRDRSGMQELYRHRLFKWSLRC